MDIRINTIADLKAALANLDLASGAELQKLRFDDGNSLVLKIVERKFGNIVTLIKTT